MEIKEYKRTVQYYETDKMGITHHSNYIRWMEEARVDYLEQIGWSYAKLEQTGVVSPVVNVDVNYKKPTTFSDEITIKASIIEYSGVKVIFKYVMTNKNGDVVCEARSIHVFLGTDGKVLFVSKWCPELHETINSLVVKE